MPNRTSARWLSQTLCGFAVCALVGAAQPAAGGLARNLVQPDIPKPALILFWAAWCAPCRAEIADYGKIAAAADPVPVVVISLDTPKRRAQELLAGIPPQRLRLGTASSIEVFAKWPNAAGLPLSIATDRRGETCGILNGRLTAGRVADLLSGCGGAP